MKGIIFVSDDQYHLGTHFMQEIQQDLMQLSIATDWVDFSDPLQSQRLVSEAHTLSTYDFIFSYNGVGVALRTMDDGIAKQMDNMTLYVLCVDHPMYQLERVSQTNAIMLCVDHEHVKFCELLGFTAYYFPHAVGAHSIQPDKFVPVHAKTNEIVFPVSFLDTHSCRQQLAPVWDQISNFIDKVSNITHFMQCLGALPLPGETDTVILSPQSLYICVWVDKYLRAKERERILLTCAQQKIKLTVIGKDVERYRSLCDFHEYDSELTVERLQQRIRTAKYVLHQSPGCVQGLHERVVMPIALGTLVLTDEPFVQTTLPQVVTLNELATVDDTDYEYKLDMCVSQVMQTHIWLHQLTPIMQQLRQQLAKPLRQGRSIKTAVAIN